MIGLICSAVARIKSGKYSLNEKEITILYNIIIMWSWKYKILSKKLKEV